MCVYREGHFIYKTEREGKEGGENYCLSFKTITGYVT